jgi:hypothetical protein
MSWHEYYDEISIPFTHTLDNNFLSMETNLTSLNILKYGPQTGKKKTLFAGEVFVEFQRFIVCQIRNTSTWIFSWQKLQSQK